jgi:hypothetical protein
MQAHKNAVRVPKQEPFSRTFFGRPISEEIIRSVPPIRIKMPIHEVLMSSPSGLRDHERRGYF